jgi:hypothetical protein
MFFGAAVLATALYFVPDVNLGVMALVYWAMAGAARWREAHVARKEAARDDR